MSTLAIVPTHLRQPLDGELVVRCLVSLWSTAPDVEVLVVDDHSPAVELVGGLESAVVELGQTLVRHPRAEGFAHAVNAGLRRALEAGQDALIVHPDVQFVEPGWHEALQGARDAAGRPAAIAGARLLAPDGLLQQAGLFFSMLTRSWQRRFAYAPADLPEALRGAPCPVSAVLQLVRHDTLRTVGLYDEDFRVGYEDVDYCLRAHAAGLEPVYEPGAAAVHYDALWDGLESHDAARAQILDLQWLYQKHAEVDLHPFIPEV